MIAKGVLFFGRDSVLACDAKCNKAWGINNRPKHSFDDCDDYAFLADGELSEAPMDPGTCEGGQGKPMDKEERLNKWCARECERSAVVEAGEEFSLPDFSSRRYNQPSKHDVLSGAGKEAVQ